MPILQGATGIHIYGGNFNDVAGDYVSVNRDYMVNHTAGPPANSKHTTSTNLSNDPTDNDCTDSGSEHSTELVTGRDQDQYHEPHRAIDSGQAETNPASGEVQG